MIAGINRKIQHEGKMYHVQAEDLGAKAGCVEMKVYDAGNLLWLKRLDYQHLLQEGRLLPEGEREIRLLIDKTIKTVHAAIVRGRIG